MMQSRLMFVLWQRKSPSSDCPIKALALKLHKIQNVLMTSQSKVDDAESKKQRCPAIIGIMRLEKVAQSLIKDPILISKASPCFTVSLIVKMDFNSIKVHSLLDFGAFTCFMDTNFVDCHKLPFIIKKHPIPIEVIDGRSLVSGNVTYETIPLDIVIKGHHSIIVFNVIKSPSKQVVLGLSWLNKYNPAIDWKTQRLTFSQILF